MQVNLRRLTGTSLWLTATGLVLLFEAQMICHRMWSVTMAAPSPTHSLQRCEPVNERTALIGDAIRMGGTGQRHTSAILVVGSASSTLAGEFDVTLKIEQADTQDINSNNCRTGQSERELSIGAAITGQALGSTENRLPTSSHAKTGQFIPPKSLRREVSRRVFFIHTQGDSLEDPASYSALECHLVGESASIRVYADQSVVDGEQLEKLTAELTQSADDSIGPAVHALVGPARDVDGDGKLAVVLTSQLGLKNTALANVDGLTRASDFVRQILRPFGNEADVIFLNASLQPDERLRAVFAHEWAHAAIFGRRYDDHDLEQAPSEDDWLNEALAHWIEVRAASSSSNVAHRIQCFLERPEAAPLLVRDYYRPEFWRHHGCRGAAFLFLDWSVRKSGPQFLDELIDGDEIGVENLERASGRSFDELFREWTTEIGTSLTRKDKFAVLAPEGDVSNSTTLWRQQAISIQPKVHEWRPKQFESRTFKLRLRSTTAAYVRVTLETAAANWRVVAVAPPESGLQLTAIPIEQP